MDCQQIERTSIVPATSQNIRLDVSPNPAFVDEDIRIRVFGAAPHQKIQIRAATEDDDKRRWSSHAEFRADVSGCVDMAAQKSLGGAYHGISSMGLFWSMRLSEEHANGRTIFTKNNASPHHVSVEVEVNGKIAASALLERKFSTQGTETRDLKISSDTSGGSENCVGRLFLPPGRGPHPVVIVLSGSGGGFDLDKAAVLSSHGFATFALAYFGIPPLPTWLHRIPLDYFNAALEWLRAQPEVDSNRIGVLGVSRGAELALLLGTTFPQIRAVVAYAPSHIAWAAGGRDKTTGENIPSWTFQDEPIPFAPLPLRGFMLRSAFPVVALRRPVLFRNLFRAGLRNREAVARALISVEKIHGPILLVSGGDDHVWPASRMSEAILARLKQRQFAYPAEHLHYPRTGHMLRYPHLPTTSRESRHTHLRNARFSFGGTASADAEANTDSWRRAILFLRSSLDH